MPIKNEGGRKDGREGGKANGAEIAQCWRLILSSLLQKVGGSIQLGKNIYQEPNETIKANSFSKRRSVSFLFSLKLLDA